MTTALARLTSMVIVPFIETRVGQPDVDRGISLLLDAFLSHGLQGRDDCCLRKDAALG